MVSPNFKKVYNSDEILMGQAGSAGDRICRRKGLMRRLSSLSTDNVLRFLEVTSGGANLEGIARGLGLDKSDRRPLVRMVAKLKKRKLIQELPEGRFILAGQKPQAVPLTGSKAEPRNRGQAASGPANANQNTPAGRLIVHQDGYGFVVPDLPVANLDRDIFIPPGALGDAMHGDHVLVELGRLTPRPDGQRAEGRIARILDRAHPTVVGLFRYLSHGNVVVPYDHRIQHQIEIPAGGELTAELKRKYGAEAKEAGSRIRRVGRLPELDGAVVNVELTRFPRGGISPVGRVIEILGKPGDLGVDTEIIIRKHHLPHVFSAEVTEEAARRAHPVHEKDIERREDFRELPIVTIDGETARDFDRAVPMLPESLSNGICSLNPREDRLVMSCLMEFDSAGLMRASRMAPGVIRSAERMTYSNVNKVLEGEAETSARYAPLVHRFQDMKTLALLLNARRNEQGSIDFDLPEPVIEFDDEQRMINITRSERNIAHRLIEEFMLAANRAVAGYLLRRGLATLHRVHEKPDAKKVLEFEDMAKAFGYTLGVADLYQREIAVRHGRVPAPAKRGRQDSYGHGRERAMRVTLAGSGEISITPQHYQRLLRKLAGKPEERIVSYLMLRSLKQARYAGDSLGHFALGFDEYAHFTSPIRRYPDLIVHRALKWALANPEANPPKDAHTPKNGTAALYAHRVLEELASETSDAERRAANAERELRDWKTAQFMEQHLGDEYEGLIISVQKYGCFVELMEVFVEGLLPIGALEDAAGTRCVFRERDHAIVALGGSERSG